MKLAILPISVRPLARTRRELGLSLVELMISIAIGLILLLGITSLIVRQSNTRNEMEKSSEQIENGRYAIQLLHDDIEHAGFYSYYYNLPAPTSMYDPCQVSPIMGSNGLEGAMSLPIMAYGYLPTTTSTCGNYGLTAQNYKPGTWILVVRRVDTNSISYPFTTSTAFTANAGAVYLQANIASHVLDTSPNTGNFTLSFNTNTAKGIAPIFQYMVHVYFISPCDVPANGSYCQVAANGTGPDDNGRPIPTLKRLDLTGVNGTTTFTVTPLAEGIEDMQLQFGRDYNGDGYPDSYVGVPGAAPGWAGVVSVAVNLLAMNTQCTLGYTDNNSYNLGAGLVPASTYRGTVAPCTNGDYKRHVFSEVVRATNVSERLAQQ